MEIKAGRIITFSDPFREGQRAEGLVIERFPDSFELRVLTLQAFDGKFVVGNEEVLVHADDVTDVSGIFDRGN